MPGEGFAAGHPYAAVILDFFESLTSRSDSGF
jgi:hypothetical protein